MSTEQRKAVVEGVGCVVADYEDYHFRYGPGPDDRVDIVELLKLAGVDSRGYDDVEDARRGRTGRTGHTGHTGLPPLHRIRITVEAEPVPAEELEAAWAALAPDDYREPTSPPVTGETSTTTLTAAMQSPALRAVLLDGATDHATSPWAREGGK